MKTTRRIVAIVLVLSILFVLTACSKKDKLIGAWKFTEMSITFNEDGTCALSAGGESQNGKYTVDGDKISINWEGEEEMETMTIKSVDDSELVLENNGVSITFTK